MTDDREQASVGSNLQRLWTPWRASFVMQEQPAGCFLCRAAEAPASDDAGLFVLLRRPQVIALLNAFPYNTGHLLIAPRLHTGEYGALPERELQAMFALSQQAVRVLRDEYRPQGFNVGLNLGVVAGAGVPDHLHLHIVPRWGGDTNFMTTIGETKVLPESLDQTYARLRPHFDALPD